jgi:hypothetical protein
MSALHATIWLLLLAIVSRITLPYGWRHMKAVRPRSVRVAAIAVLFVFLIAISANGARIGDFWVSVWAVVGGVLGISAVRKLRRERNILSDACRASATVVRVWRPVLGRRGLRRMSYEFLAANGKRYLGRGIAPYPLPEAGRLIDVIYRRDRPTDNLPKRQFWFHELQAGL